MENVRFIVGKESRMSNGVSIFLRRKLFFGNPKNKDSMMITIEISKPHKKDFDVACKVYIKGYREKMHEIFGIDDIDAIKNACLFDEKIFEGNDDVYWPDGSRYG